MKHSATFPPDLRAFLFTATGDTVDPNKVSAIELYDNLIIECDRLRTLAELLSVRQEALEAEGATGLALLLGDVERRSRAILEAFGRSRAARPKG